MLSIFTYLNKLFLKKGDILELSKINLSYDNI